MEQKREFVEITYFHETIMAELFTIHVSLHTMKFPVKQISWKFQKSTKFTALEKRAPYGNTKSCYISLRYTNCNSLTLFSAVVFLVRISSHVRNVQYSKVTMLWLEINTG